MKKQTVLGVLECLLGVLIAIGAFSITGYSAIGLVTGMGLAMTCLGATAFRCEQLKRRACADARKELCDSVVAAGTPLTINGKPWKNGCRFDPDSCAVIDPS